MYLVLYLYSLIFILLIKVTTFVAKANNYTLLYLLPILYLENQHIVLRIRYY